MFMFCLSYLLHDGATKFRTGFYMFHAFVIRFAISWWVFSSLTWWRNLELLQFMLALADFPC